MTVFNQKPMIENNRVEREVDFFKHRVNVKYSAIADVGVRHGELILNPNHDKPAISSR